MSKSLMDELEPKNKRWFPKIFWTLVLVFMILFGVVFAKAYSFGSKVFVNRSSFFKKLTSVVFSGSSSKLQGEDQGRINILLLGYGGEGHDGPYLTDTMILASIDPNKKQVNLTSIPRDLYWPQGQQKINFAFVSGFQKSQDFDQGGEAAEAAVGQISGLDIPYFASIDFSGFEKAVDRVGGIDVQVDNTFTDSQYPNDSNYGYLPPITFTKGVEHMDGQRALEFARSRHGNNGEDSDFARSKRQEKIIAALKNKVQQENILSSTGTINDLLNIVADHAHTNIDPSELLHLASILRSPDLKVTSQSLDVDTNLICQSSSDTLGYILVPCPGISNSQIQDFFKNGFTNGGLRAENSSLIIENAGSDPNYYETVKTELQAAGIQVYEVPYKGIQIQTSVLYVVNNKPATIQYLEQLLNIKSQPKPDSMVAKTDLVLFLVPPQ